MVSSPRHSRHLGETMWLLSDATNFFSIELEHKKTPRTHIHTIRIALYVAFKVTHTEYKTRREKSRQISKK